MAGTTLLLLGVVLVIIVVFASSYRVYYLVADNYKNLNSRIHYYGMFGLLCTGLPVLIIYFFWWLIIPFYLEATVVEHLINSFKVSSDENISLLVGQVETIRDTFLSADLSKTTEIFNQTGTIDYEVMASLYDLSLIHI